MELSERKILIPEFVASNNLYVEELQEAVLSYLNSTEGQKVLRGDYNFNIHRDKLPRGLFNLHPDKLSSEIRNLLRSLSLDGWMNVDQGFGNFYMTILAAKLSERLRLSLLTDKSDNSSFGEKLKVSSEISKINRVPLRENALSSYAVGGLSTLIINNFKFHPDTTVEDILDFKSENKNELGKFRKNLSDLVKDPPKGLSFKGLQEYSQEIYIDKFLPSYNDLKGALDDSGIRWTLDNLLKISFFSTTATSLPLLLGLTIPQAVIAGSGVSLAISAVSYRLEKKRLLRDNPFAYLYKATKSLGRFPAKKNQIITKKRARR